MTDTATKPVSATTRNLPLVLFGVGLFTSLLTIFVGWRAQGFVDKSPDPYNYVAMARSLLQGQGFAPYGSVLNRRGPLYPALIALVYFFTGERPWLLQIVQALMLSGTCALAFDIGRRLYNLRTGVIAGLLCAFHPALLRYVADFHVETFLTFLSTVAIWRGVLFLERPGVKNGALFGLVAALGALTKPVVLLYPLAFGAWWLFRSRRPGFRLEVPERAKPEALPREAPTPRLPWPAAMVAVAAIFVTMGAVILPWTYRNYRSSGHVILITTGFGDAFLRGYIFSKPDYALLRLPPYTYAEQESNASFEDICRRAGTVWQRNDVESEKILSRVAKEKLRAEPGAFVRKFVVQLFTFWYQMTSWTNSVLAGIAAILLWVLALVGWRRARTEHHISWPLFLPILCLNLSLAVLLALGRYSVPILPALVVLAAFGIDTILSWFRSRGRPQSA